jgi:predicted enzyme related to lactoylglutathione lyase
MSDTVDMRLEVVVIPVADVDRAKEFYAGLGWRFDIDLEVDDNTRVVQFTPPGSACSIHIGTGITPAEPGSNKNTYLIVEDIEAARAALTERGAEVTEPFHRENGEVVPGRDPNGTSYGTYASFSDPDGNTWMLQEITERLPGR